MIHVRGVVKAIQRSDGGLTQQILQSLATLSEGLWCNTIDELIYWVKQESSKWIKSQWDKKWICHACSLLNLTEKGGKRSGFGIRWNSVDPGHAPCHVTSNLVSSPVKCKKSLSVVVHIKWNNVCKVLRTCNIKGSGIGSWCYFIFVNEEECLPGQREGAIWQTVNCVVQKCWKTKKLVLALNTDFPVASGLDLLPCLMEPTITADAAGTWANSLRLSPNNVPADQLQKCRAEKLEMMSRREKGTGG